MPTGIIHMNYLILHTHCWNEGGLVQVLHYTQPANFKQTCKGNMPSKFCPWKLNGYICFNINMKTNYSLRQMKETPLKKIFWCDYISSEVSPTIILWSKSVCSIIYFENSVHMQCYKIETFYSFCSTDKEKKNKQLENIFQCFWNSPPQRVYHILFKDKQLSSHMNYDKNFQRVPESLAT